MPLSVKDAREQSFWKWFEKNQDDLYHFEKHTEAVFDRLATEMHKVHEDLTSEVHYAIFKDEDPMKVGIMIFMDGYTENDKESVWRQIGYLFLDEALGEFDVETNVGAIVFFDRHSRYFEHARPLAELASHFDEKLGR